MYRFNSHSYFLRRNFFTGTPLKRPDRRDDDKSSEKEVFVFKDYYSIMGLPRGASKEEIKEKYHQLAIKLHPDRSREDRNKEQNMNRFKEITEAYQVLKDPQKRLQIDDYLSDRAHYLTHHRGRFVDSLSWAKRRPGSTTFQRSLDIVTSPRILLMSSGLLLLGYAFFGPHAKEHDYAIDSRSAKVTAWFNPQTNRWETPAPWNETYRQNMQHEKKIDRYLVYESVPPSTPSVNIVQQKDKQ